LQIFTVLLFSKNKNFANTQTDRHRQNKHDFVGHFYIQERRQKQ